MVMRLAGALLLFAMVAGTMARSCRNPNTCRNNGECVTPKSGKGFNCLCAAGYKGKRCEHAAFPIEWLSYGSSTCEYLIVEKPTMQYNDAVDACRRHGGNLVFIDNDGLNNFLGTQGSPEDQKVSRWIGLKRDRKGDFAWKSGDDWDDVFSYAAWEAGYPGINTVDRCVFQDTREGVPVWLVDNCKDHRRFICQRCEGWEEDVAGTRRRRRRRRSGGRITEISDEFYCGDVLVNNAISTFMEEQTSSTLESFSCPKKTKKKLVCDATFEGDSETYRNKFKCKRNGNWKVLRKPSFP